MRTLPRPRDEYTRLSSAALRAARTSGPGGACGSRDCPTHLFQDRNRRIFGMSRTGRSRACSAAVIVSGARKLRNIASRPAQRMTLLSRKSSLLSAMRDGVRRAVSMVRFGAVAGADQLVSHSSMSRSTTAGRREGRSLEKASQVTNVVRTSVI